VITIGDRPIHRQIFGFYRYLYGPFFISLNRCWQNAVIFLTHPHNLRKTEQWSKSGQLSCKKVTGVLENFSFFTLVNWMHSIVGLPALTSLTWCSILHFFLFIVHHLSTLKHCFCFFCCKQFSFIQSSVIIALLFLRQWLQVRLWTLIFETLFVCHL